MIEAGGGVIWRTKRGALQVFLIHRPDRDWSVPKGKREPGESMKQCALREVEEETGFRCELGPEISTASYDDRKGRAKTVRYWAMTVGSGSFRPNAEADDGRWLTIAEALELVTADRDTAAITALQTALSGV